MKNRNVKQRSGSRSDKLKKIDRYNPNLQKCFPVTKCFSTNQREARSVAFFRLFLPDFYDLSEKGQEKDGKL